MIVAQRKAFEDIAQAVSGYRRVLVVGCGTCVAVCLAGGEKEAGILAAQLEIHAGLAGREARFGVACVERQCDREFLAELAPEVERHDAVLSLACGAGVQFLAQAYPGVPVLAGVNTTGIAVNQDVGVWERNCRACGSCLLTVTGGICPVSLCAKGLVNGPCGGAVDGKCETDRERDCAWHLIYQRLEASGRLANLEEVVPVRDHGAAWLPKRQVHPAYQRRYQAHE